MLPVSLIIDSKEKFSSTKFPVLPAVTYELSCDGTQRWCDSYIKTSPKGFWNPLASIAGLRVKKVKCFCLCGCYDDDLHTAFAIGTGCRITSDRKGYLSFFANDADAHYRNNEGSIVLKIRQVSDF